tara:strand:- start:1819 stop:2436 length:618 start_codon:yes stop_codon:yes gene_type:complete
MISEYLIISNVLTEEECVDSITSIELDRSAEFLDGKVGEGSGDLDHDIRSTKTKFIHRGRTTRPQLVELFRKIDAQVQEANILHFDVDISGGCYDLQTALYLSDDKDYYSTHVDSELFWYNLPPKPYIRKLSCILYLSDDKNYTGGDISLLNMYGEEVIRDEDREFLNKRGNILIFPSFLRHSVTPVTTGQRMSVVFWYMGRPWR